MSDRNVEEVIRLIREREAKGMKVYGRTTCSGYSQIEMLTHARDEALDLAIYLTELLRQARGETE